MSTGTVGGPGAIVAKLAQATKSIGGSGAPNPATDMKKTVEDWLPDLYQRLKSAYLVFHQSAWESSLMYAGQVWLDWDTSKKAFREFQYDDEYVPKPQLNRFSPAVDALCANFARVPEVEAVPDPLDSLESVAVADIANDLADHFVTEAGLDSDYKDETGKVHLASQLFVLCGNVFTHVYPRPYKHADQPQMETVPSTNGQCATCDTIHSNVTPPPDGSPLGCPTCGNPMETYPVASQRPQMGPDGTPVTKPIYRYSIECRVGDPICALPRPGSQSLGRALYCGWAERMAVADLVHDWGFMGIKEADIEPDNDQLDGNGSAWANSLQYYYEGYSSESFRNEDSCLVVFMYVEPGRMEKFPNGCFAIMVKGEVKAAVPWPFVEAPLTHARYHVIPRLFFGRSVAFDLAKVQREKLDYESLIKLHSMTSAVDPVVVDENTQVSEITGRSDVIIYWKSIGPGSKEPHRMQHGTLDNGVYVQRDRLDSEFDNISGAVAVYRGQAPGSVTAASAIGQLRGQAELMFSKPQDAWNGMWKETVRKGVKNMQKYYSVPEILDIVGSNKLKQVMAFKTADLDKMVNWVSTTHGLPRTRDERRQEMITLFDHGALDINDVNVREKVFELFGETGMMKQFTTDATRARLENSQFKSGQVQLVRFMPMIEDLQVHFMIHAEQIKSLDFDTWPPPAQEALLQHAMLTKQAMEAAVEAQGLAAAARAAKPGGGPGGAAGPVGAGAGPHHPPAGKNKEAAAHPPELETSKTQQGTEPSGVGSRGPISPTPGAPYSNPIGGGRY